MLQARRPKNSTAKLLKVVQRNGEYIIDYISMFSKEGLSVVDLEADVSLIALTNEVRVLQYPIRLGTVIFKHQIKRPQ